VVQVGQGEKTMNQAGLTLIYSDQLKPSLKMMSLCWPSLNHVKNSLISVKPSRTNQVQTWPAQKISNQHESSMKPSEPS
jgi:hypothetical protein